jgi:hypothetical protein
MSCACSPFRFSCPTTMMPSGGVLANSAGSSVSATVDGQRRQARALAARRLRSGTKASITAPTAKLDTTKME